MEREVDSFSRWTTFVSSSRILIAVLGLSVPSCCFLRYFLVCRRRTLML